MTPQEARALFYMLDLIDEANPQPGDVLQIKSVLIRLIRLLIKE